MARGRLPRVQRQPVCGAGQRGCDGTKVSGMVRVLAAEGLSLAATSAYSAASLLADHI